MNTGIQYRESSPSKDRIFDIERRETNDKRLLIMQNSICEQRETSDERLSFLQNEPNFKISRFYATTYMKSGSANFMLYRRPKNEPKRTQNEPNFEPKLASFSSILALNFMQTDTNINEKQRLTGVGIGDRLAGVEKANKKPVIGILGGIGAGKSTTAAEFERLGCGLIDADKIAHKLLDEPQIKQKIIEAFGSSILDTDNKIGRKKLAEIVFAEKGQLTQLNNIIHPVVLARAEELIEEYNGRDEVKAIVLDMPLLVEVGWEKMCEKLIFIDCKAEKRAERSRKTHLFDENQLKIRENLQISLDKKQAIADNTIDNNSELQALKKQVAEIFSYIVEK